MGKILSIWDWDRDEVIELWEDGYNSFELAEEFDCSQGSILRMLKENGVDTSRRWKDYTLGKEDVICSEYQDGETLKNLGKKYRCDLKKIRALLVDNGVKIRKSGSGRRRRRNVIRNVH